MNEVGRFVGLPHFNVCDINNHLFNLNQLGVVARREKTFNFFSDFPDEEYMEKSMQAKVIKVPNARINRINNMDEWEVLTINQDFSVETGGDKASPFVLYMSFQYWSNFEEGGIEEIIQIGESIID